MTEILANYYCCLKIQDQENYFKTGITKNKKEGRENQFILVIWTDTFVELQILYPKWAHFIKCKFYLNKIAF